MTHCKRLLLFLSAMMIYAQCAMSGIPTPILDEMTVEEKAGQLLMAHFNGETLNDDARQLIQRAHIGSVIYYNWANGLHSPKQVQKLSNDLQKYAREQRLGIPLLIAVDQEGGFVNRLSNGFTVFAGNYALGQTGDPKFVLQSAFATGCEMRAVGINMNLAPVVDVNSNPLKSALGMRCFGSSPEIVALLGGQALEGYRNAKVIATLKHFPGYGEAAVDPHLELPVVNKSKEELERIELLPFKKLCAFADAIMSAHVLVPALDPKNCATLSSSIIEGLLRKQWEYEGVILSDSLVMQGLLNACGDIDEAAIRAIESGHDMLILGGKLLNRQQTNELSVKDIVRIHQHIVNAVHSGRIPLQRLNASVQRILKLKEKYGLFEAIYPGDDDIALQVNSLEHQQLAKDIAKASVKIIQSNASSPLKIADKKIGVVAPAFIQEAILQSTMQNHSKRCLFVQDLAAPTLVEKEQASEIVEYADLLIIFTLNAWRSPEQSQFVKSLQSQNKPFLIVAIRDPQDAELFPQADAVAAIFSPTALSIQTALDLIIRP